MNTINTAYIERALELARMGEIGSHPNPMVGAVITDSDGRIIGEGYHHTCGQGHAEVNAVADADRHGADLTDATIYLTLEPCAHWGKTPPCARLLIDRRIPRCVIGTTDPFAKVSGRGIAMLREAGIEVTVLDGDIARRCRELNRRFLTAHTLKRPYVALKWAMTADGFVDRLRRPDEQPLAISSAAGRIAVHRYRSTFDAIAVGSTTLLTDRPRLDARLWPGGRAPRRIEFTRGDLTAQLGALYADGITSLLVEGGPTLQQSFIDSGLVDEMRLEPSPLPIGSGIAAPRPELSGFVSAPAGSGNIKIMLKPEPYRL